MVETNEKHSESWMEQLLDTSSMKMLAEHVDKEVIKASDKQFSIVADHQNNKLNLKLKALIELKSIKTNI